MENKTIKCLVVSGGGAKGAFAGGVIEFLDSEYDLYIGTSTGALIIPLAAADEIKLLKSCYTNTTQKDIFKVNPFKVKKKSDGTFDVDMNFLNIAYNLIIRGKKSFGDSSNLRKKIESFVTPSVFEAIKISNVDVLICVTNSNLGLAEYKSIKDCTISEFHDWIWASTSAYPFMDSVVVNGQHYVDGGFTDPCPIQEAINRGATEIDVIVLKPEDGRLVDEPIKNPLQGLGRMIDVMLKEINKNDIQIASLNALNSDVILNIYYTPRVLTNNPLVFDKDLMTGWWNEGFEYAKSRLFSKYLVKGPNLENLRIGVLKP
jgi:predicted patatin/cPLA2 family phospholipase